MNLKTLFGFGQPTPRTSAAPAAPAVPADAVLIDVRSPGEFASGHVEGSINVPLGELPHRIAKVAPDKAVPILLCCASGARSGAALQFLQGMGYTAARNAGGVGQLALISGRAVRQG